MKKLFLLLLMVCGFAQAQIVNIPDANFKAKLLQADVNNYIAKGISGYIKIDVNGDGEIQQSEALMVLELNVRLSNISNMTGIASFANLELLNCEWNLITGLDVTALVNLTTLKAYSCALTSLNVNGCANLNSIDCARNFLTSLDVSGLLNLSYLYCSNNQLTSITLNPLTDLESLNCSNNQLMDLNVNGFTGLTGLFCENNLLSTLTISNLSNLVSLSFGNPGLVDVDVNTFVNLTTLYFYGGLQTTMDISNLTNLNMLSFYGTSLISIDASNNPNVIEFFVSDNPNLEYLNVKDGTDNYVGISDCPNLINICANETAISAIISNIQTGGGNNLSAVVTSYCSFTPGGNYNTITGAVIFDADNNGCDASDLPQSFVKVKINDGVTEGASFGSETGNYIFYTQTGSFTITPDVENPSFFNFSPVNATISFPDNNNNVATQNFCTTANGVHPDLEVVVYSWTSARPGTDMHYSIVYKNKGNQVMSQPYGVTFSFNQYQMNLVSASVPTSSQTPGTLTWDYANLMPFESRTIDVVMHINTPTDANPVNLDDILQLTATISPMLGDENVMDNTFQYSQMVVNSYDPNNKICLEGETESPTKIGDYLHYVINFENVGTDDAINVVVKDVIDMAKFDEKTLQILGSSHPVKAKISGNIAEFVFENINLARGGHGNILLKVKTKDNLVIGDVVTNKADIFFDYNASIETNMASTRFESLGITEAVVDNLISIYPNPTNDVINVKSESTIQSIQLFDVQGRVLQTRIPDSHSETIDLSSKSSGVYFVKITTKKGSKTEKIIKK